MRVVVDTNVFIGAFFFGNHHAREVIRKARANEITLVMNKDTYQELVGVFSDHLERVGLSNKQSASFIRMLGKIDLVPHRTYSVLSEDPSDNMFIDCAMDGNATCIISEDGSHLFGLEEAVFREYRKHIRIMSPWQFLTGLAGAKR